MTNVDFAKTLGINEKEVFYYSPQIAKVENVKGKKNGKLVLVTAMTSNKTGIGKTTVSIGLADALSMLGESTLLALREPSMGPVFGIKGGATGGGKSLIVPSDEINLHFTGDFYAIAQANNLLSSIIDNHIFQGNELRINPQKIFFKRCLDLNDRCLREISYCIKGKEVKTGFNITAASEVMAILCLSETLKDLKNNLGNILVAENEAGEPIFAKDLNVQEAMTILLQSAFRPNVVQTLEGTAALVHLGPFANIAHGCNSVVATKFALSHADYCITESGFGSDLGAEKFIDIKSRVMNKFPDVVVLVIVVKVIKEHGSGNLQVGFENVKRHIENLQNVFKANVVVAINKHSDDTEDDLECLKNWCQNLGVTTEVSQGYEKGGKGCLNLAESVVKQAKKGNKMQFCYDLSDSIKEKIEKIAVKVYGAGRVSFSREAEEKIQKATEWGFGNFFVNIAKTQFSFSDDKNLLGAPKGFEFKITDIEIRSGAKTIVAIAGNMLLMPGLAKNSNYLDMHIDENGNVSGIV
ncbi:MAG: formate--tetrahydrofolate ligase [Clostridia bacterium]|nr:formate--tetrahydrofolate ligase [Clostridia bacterium]